LKNHWIGTKLLKLKSFEDRITEDLDNRTIIVRNIPKEFRKEDILTHFSDFGAIMAIELPMINRNLEKLNLEKGELDQFTKEKRMKKEENFLRAEKLMEERLNTD